jgi:alpha-amylase/alpha-mannosidase (GH57 family)
MHQPDYRLEGTYLKPWTWLHAIKDYSDMAAHLESVPDARAVVNFSPVLMEQLLDYPVRMRAFIEHDEPMGDAVLDALGAATPVRTELLTAQLLRVHEQRMKPRFEPYSSLFDRARDPETKLGDAGFADLLVWYVLVWLGESLRELPLVRRLSEKASGYTFEDRRNLLSTLAEIIEALLPRYRALAERGAVELSVTPYAHPMLPLLLDFKSAREAMPQAPLPDEAYPGGAERAEWHLAGARQLFRRCFGTELAGCWPSEGGLSQESLRLLSAQGFTWTASGSQVLHNTLRRSGREVTHAPQLNVWRPEEAGLPFCFFRDDDISDLIGFEYSKWTAEEAVDHLIARIEQRGEEFHGSGGQSPVLSIIMDGENAWEYFPQNGWEFLNVLYTRLARHPRLRLSTFSDIISSRKPLDLPKLCAGSWVHGNFSTWIGEPAKNRAWNLLCKARRAVDAALDPLNKEALPDWAKDVLRQLAICEASDWSWWLSEHHPMQDSPEFDALYRQQLSALYRMLGMVPPDVLGYPIARSQGSADGGENVVGAMRRSASGGNPD